MKTLLSQIKRLLFIATKPFFLGFFLCFTALVFIASGQELYTFVGSDEDSVKKLQMLPRIDYPEDLPIHDTPWELMELHISTVRAPDSTWKKLPRVTDIRATWKHAEIGDEIYDLTDWFLTAKQQKVRKGKENRWVYYNKTSGYIIAYADLFLKSTVQTFALHSMMLNGFSPRLQIIYLEVSDQAELSFEAIRKSPHRVLFRNSMSFTSKTSLKRGGEASQYTVNIVDIIPAFDRSSYSFTLKLNVEETIIYENNIDLVPSHWVIHECGISERGKRKVLAMKIDHVSRQGENLSFPVENRISEINSVRIDTGFDEDPFGDTFKEFHAFYRVPSDMFNILGPDNDEENNTNEDAFPGGKDERVLPNIKDVSWIFSQMTGDLEGYYFIYQNLLLVKSSEDVQWEIKEWMAELELRKILPLVEGRLLFYEIDVVPDHAGRAWEVEDMLSANPVKLGSIGSILASGSDAMIRSGDDDCELMMSCIESYENPERRSEYRQLEWKLNLPSMNITHKGQIRLKLGETKVILLGKNPKNNKLKMMVVNIRELETK